MAQHFANWLRDTFTENYVEDLKERCTGGCKEPDKCLQVLNALVDGQASAEDEAFMRTHIIDCLECFETHEWTDRLKADLGQQVIRPVPSAKLAERIRAAIGLETALT